MSAPSIEDCLRRLRKHLAGRTDADDLVDEYADHLWTAYEIELTHGLPAAGSE